MPVPELFLYLDFPKSFNYTRTKSLSRKAGGFFVVMPYLSDLSPWGGAALYEISAFSAKEAAFDALGYKAKNVSS